MTHAEAVPDLEVRSDSIGPVGVDEKAVVAPEKTRLLAIECHGFASESACHRGVTRNLHRQRVLGSRPCGMFADMAAGAGGRADEGRGRQRRWLPRKQPPGRARDAGEQEGSIQKPGHPTPGMAWL